MKKNLADRLLSLVMCLCLLMSTASFDMLAAIAESPETVTTPTDVEEPSEEATEAPTPESLFGDVNGDGQVTVDDLRQLLAEGLTLTEAASRMPLSVLNGAVAHERFEAELWSDAQGTQRERLSHAEVVWRDIPTGVQCDDALGYRAYNYPAIEGYAAQSLMLGDQYVTAMTLLTIGEDEALYVDTVWFEHERRIEGCALLSAGEKLVIRYVAAAQEPDEEPEAEPTDEPEPLPGAVLAVQAMIDALPTADELAAMDADAQRMVYAQTQAAYEAYQGLTEEQQALIVGAEAFEALFDAFNGQIMTLDAVTLDMSGGSITITDEGYRIGSGAITPHAGEYIITGSSGSDTITVNVTGTVDITFQSLSLTGHNKTILQIQSGVVYVTLEGSNTLQCHQDYLSANAVEMSSGAELHFNGSGMITIHGSSNYWGGGDAIRGGNVFIHGGTVTLVGGNKIDGDFGKCFDGVSITVDGGDLNYYQGVITSKDRGVISANEASYQSGKVNGNTLVTDEVPVPEAESVICTGVTLKTVSFVKYRVDGGSWQESPVFTGLAEGSTHTFDQTRILEDPYFLSNSVNSATFTLPRHQWSEPVFNGIDKGTHTKTCSICDMEQTEMCSGGSASYFQQAICAVCAGVYETYLTDTTAPTGSIQLGQNAWTTLLDTITFELFYPDAQTVTIQATDDSVDHDGYTEANAVKVAYYIHDGDAALTSGELDERSFAAYEGSVSLSEDGKYTVYARLTDWAGHVTYLSSNGIVVDQTPPVIRGIEDGETYQISVSFTVTEANLKEVTVNGEVVQPDASGTYTLDLGQKTIVVTDKAGNSVTCQVTVERKDISETAVTLTPDSFIFNGSAQQPTVTVRDGDATLRPGTDYTVDYTNNINVGAATATITGIGNYEGTVDVTFAITPATPVVTAPEAIEGLVYDGTAQRLITAGSTSGGTMVYSLTENGEYAETIPTGTNAGTYQVWYKVVGNDNYVGTATQSVTVTIARAEQAALTIANGPERVTYGDDPFTLLASGGSGTGALTWAVTEGAAYASVDANGQVTVIGAGEAVITVTKAADSNHKDAVTATYALTVDRRALTASISGDTTKAYDGSTAAPDGLRITLAGLVFGDAVTASAQGYAYDAVQTGPRIITATGIALDDSEKAANYALTADTAAVDGEITARIIDIGAQTFTYDGGRVFTVDVDGVTLADGTVETIAVTLTTDSRDAGDHDPAVVTIEWDDDNYVIIISGVTIEPLTAELVWSDELSFIYDGELHGVTATVGNRLGDDDFSLTYEDNEATDAGAYTAVVIGLGNDNYALPENAGQAWTIIRAEQGEPVVKIDFFAETLVPDGAVEYSLNGEDWLPCDPSMPVTVTGWDGAEPVVIYVRCAEDDNHEVGAAIELSIPARPDAPEADIELVKSRTAITLTESDALTGCEYAIDGGDWQPTGAFDGLTAGTEHTIAYRAAATEASFASFSGEISVTTVSDDGTTTLRPGETVEAGGSKVTNDGDEIIITDEEGNTTTITPAEGTAVGEDGTVTVPEGAIIKDERFGTFTAPEGGGTFDPETGVFTPAKGAGKVSAKVQAGPDTPTIRIDMSDDALRDAALDAEDRRLVAWGWNAEIVLTIANVDGTIDARTLGLVEQAAGAYTIGRHLEITMHRTIGGETEAIHETASPIRLVIDVLQPFENDNDRGYAIIRVHDGKAALLKDEDNAPDKITVSTDRFSTYSIVYRASATPTEAPSVEPTATPAPTTVPGSEPPRTGDDSMLWLWLALLLVSGTGMAAMVIRTRTRKK